MSETASAPPTTTPAANPTPAEQPPTAGPSTPPATAPVLTQSAASMARGREVARVLRDVAATCSGCAGHVQLTDGKIACALPEGEKIEDCTLVRLAARVEDKSASCTEKDTLCQVAQTDWITAHAKTREPLPSPENKK